MEFRLLADLCERLAANTKHISMTDMVADFLAQLADGEVEPAVSMILGRPLPKWDQRTLEVSWETLSDIIRRLTRSGWNEFSTRFKATGDIGSTTQIVFEKSKVHRQSTLFEKPLTVLEVRRVFEVIAESTGYGSRERKERLVETLLGRAEPLEDKYLVKILMGDLRRPEVRGHDDDAVPEVDPAPLGVRELPVLEDLEEDVEDLRVGLLDLVEEDRPRSSCGGRPRSAGRPRRTRRSPAAPPRAGSRCGAP